MNFEKQDREVDDMELDAALKSFRESVLEWSDQEFGRARVIRRSRWDALLRVASSPLVSWTMACGLLAASVGGSLTAHHLRQVAIAHQVAIEKMEKQQQMEQQKASVEAVPAADSAMNDDELLSHVDSDIAQAAPDAMQPLASLMSETAAK